MLLVGLSCLPVRGSIPHAAAGMLLVVPVAIAGAVGGGLVALATAPVAALAYATLLLPPLDDPRVALGEDVVVLLAFLATAVVVGSIAGRHRRRAVNADGSADPSSDAEDLLKAVSHDLRTPLSTIQTVATDLATTDSYDDSTRRELMDLVAGEADRLGRMVTSLLRAVTGPGAKGAVEREPFDLGLLLEEVARRDPPGATAPVVVAPGAAGLLAMADPVGVEQVVSNLVDNARRHAPSTSRVLIGAERSGRGEVVMWVADDGPGPPAHLLDPNPRTGEVGRSVTRSATRSEGSGDGAAGFGLGLAICRRIVQAHGGELWVERRDGGGSRVCFSLPAA